MIADILFFFVLENTMPIWVTVQIDNKIAVIHTILQ